MEQTKLYEAIRLINDHSDIDDELYTAANNLKNIFTHKYITGLYSAIEESMSTSQKYPSKDIILLKALKSYTSESGSKQIDNIINSINFINTLTNLNQGINCYSNQSISALSKSTDSSISSSSIKLTKILILLIMLGKI